MKKPLPQLAKIISTLLLVVAMKFSFAQVPTTQDCLGAIPVCDYVYTEEFTASGEGNYPNELPSGQTCPNHCMAGEKNTRWYQWTVIESGDLRLNITPVTSSDDYDWAVFNLSDYNCEDIYSHPIQMMVSCNAAGGAGYHGTTGISTISGGNSDCNNGGNTNKWNADLPVYEGESYVLVVSDWTQSPGGYTLDFSSSTAVILDDFDPYLDYIGGDEITSCGTNELHITFSENVKCSSVQKGDFKFTGPGGPYVIDSIYGQNCDIGGNNEKDYYLYITPAIYQPGEYSLEIKGFSFISDACNNYADPGVFPFEINLDAPTAKAGDDIDIAYAAFTSLSGEAEGGSGDFTYQWEPADMLDDPNILTPTTVSLTNSTQFILSIDDNVSFCKSEDTMWVNVVGGPLSLTADIDNPVICNGELINLFSFPEGGSENYTYVWTSTPAGFSSTQQNPSDYPTEDMIYHVEVTDGFTTLTADVNVVVNQNPVALAGIDIDIELGNTTTLDGNANGGSGNYIYQWEPASWLEQNDIPSPTTLLLPQTTQFSLIVSDANTNCISENDDMLVIVSSDVLSAFIDAAPQSICFGEATTISAIASGGGGGYEYSWTSNPSGIETTESSFTVSPEQNTRYDLLLTDQFGNEFNGYIDVIVNPLPIIDLIPPGLPSFNQDSISVCVRDSVLIDAGFDTDPEGTTYFWQSENYINRYLTVQTTGSWIDFQTHKVVVTHGGTLCKDSGQITVIFDFNECEISVPENSAGLGSVVSILPNPNDGNFSINLKEALNDLNLKIYDIRGGLLFEQQLEGRKQDNDSYQIKSGIIEKGVYILVLQSGDRQHMQKMIIN